MILSGLGVMTIGLWLLQPWLSLVVLGIALMGSGFFMSGGR